MQKLNKSKKRLYELKKTYTKLDSTLERISSRQRTSSPLFNLSLRPSTSIIRPFNELEDDSAVRAKPSITKKATKLLRSKQETSYGWLYDRVKAPEASLLNYETLRFEIASTEALECIMPLLVKLREEEEAEGKDSDEENDVLDEKGLTRDQFTAKLCDVDIVPVYMKVQLLKTIERMREQKESEEKVQAQQKLPWAMQTKNAIAHGIMQPNKTNKYRCQFDSYQVDTKLLAQVGKKQKPAFFQFATTEQSRNSTLQLKAARTAHLKTGQSILAQKHRSRLPQQPTRLNEDLSSVSQLYIAPENLQGNDDIATAANEEFGPNTDRFTIEPALDISLAGGAVTSRLVDQSVLGSPRSLQSTTFLKSLRVQSSKAQKSMPKHRKRVATGRQI